MPSTAGVVRRLRRRPGDTRRVLRAGLVVGLYAVLALATVLPGLGRWDTAVVGDAGDSLLNLSIMDWVWDHAFAWRDLWRGQMFRPHELTLAYSEGLFPQTVLFGVLRTVLGGSDAVAFNAVLLTAWTVAFVGCHQLLRRLGCDTVAAVVGSVAWNLSAARLGHVWHFQLVTAAALIPLTVLVTLRLLDRPTVRRGLVLGAALATAVLAASYYGLMLVVATGVLVAGWVVLDRGAGLRALVAPLLAGAALAAVVVLPVWRQYESLQDDPYFRRSPEAQFSTTSDDLLVPASTSRFLTDAPILEDHPPENVERQLFPGLVILPFAVLGAVALARRRHRAGALRRRREIGLVVLLGVVMLLLSSGDRGWLVGLDEPGPYRLLRMLLPPLDGVRAPSRFGILFQLGVAVLGGLGLATLGRRLRPGAYLALGGVVLALLLVESSIRVPTTEVPDRPAWTAVNRALDDRAGGIVAELPMVASAHGLPWALVESPRQYLARIDEHPRVNGYSGFEPHGFLQRVETLNRFPSAESMALLDDLDVRYVVIRDGVVGTMDDAVLDQVEASRPRLAVTDAEIEALATTMPSEVRSVVRTGRAWLVELAP